MGFFERFEIFGESYLTHRVGIYADIKGFSCAVIGINDRDEMALRNLIYIEGCSGKKINDIVEKIDLKYRYTSKNINPSPTLEKVLKRCSGSVNLKTVDILDSVFKIKLLVTDEILEVEESIKEILENEANNFHPDVISHRLHAIALALDEIDDANWLLKLVS